MLSSFKIGTAKSFLMVLCLSSNLSYAASATSKSEPKIEDPETVLYRRLSEAMKNRVPRTTNVVLGPVREGKSTLINLFAHVIEYSSAQSENETLVDPNDVVSPIHKLKIFANSDAVVEPHHYKEESIPQSFEGIPTIFNFMPVFGPIVVEDFTGYFAERSFDFEQAASFRKSGDASTRYSEIYSLQSKVKNPLFKSNLIDAPGVHDEDNRPLLQDALDRIPKSPGHLNAFILVISGTTLASEEIAEKGFNYYSEIRKLLLELDPTFDRVFLAVTKASDNKFLNMIGSNDARRMVSEKFKVITSRKVEGQPFEEGVLIPSERIFFFENKYNCLSHSSIQKLHKCDANEDGIEPEFAHALAHRVKNYQLNLFESHRLLRAIAKREPLMRYQIGQKMGFH